MASARSPTPGSCVCTDAGGPAPPSSGARTRALTPSQLSRSSPTIEVVAMASKKARWSMSSTSRFFAVAADGSVSPIAASRILWRDSRGEELTIDAMPWALSLRCGLDHRQGTVAMLSILPMAGNCVTVMVQREDRKSTRLNSSHLVISYAVFCLKKKKTIKNQCPSYSQLGSELGAAFSLLKKVLSTTPISSSHGKLQGSDHPNSGEHRLDVSHPI